MSKSSQVSLKQLRPNMVQWKGVAELKQIKDYFDMNWAQTWNLLCDCQNQTQSQT